MTSSKPGPIAPYLDVQSVVEAAKLGHPELRVLSTVFPLDPALAALVAIGYISHTKFCEITTCHVFILIHSVLENTNPLS